MKEKTLCSVSLESTIQIEFGEEMTFKAIPNRLLCGRVLPTKFELGYEPMRTKIC